MRLAGRARHPAPEQQQRCHREAPGRPPPPPHGDRVVVGTPQSANHIKCFNNNKNGQHTGTEREDFFLYK